MYIEQIQLADFRNYAEATLRPAPEGVTLLQGGNGSGKTNLLEAVAYLATMRSFRGSPKDALIKTEAAQAVLRAKADRESRALLVEIELNRTGRDITRLNRQAVRRQEELLGAVLVTTFSPDDIEIVKGGPQSRRQYLDDLLAALHPKYGAAQAELDRVLRQRNALLREARGVLKGAMAATLDVWDAKLSHTGEVLAGAREELVAALAPLAAASYELLAVPAVPAGAPVERGRLTMSYQRSWTGDLPAAISAARLEDLRRAVTTVGPQRDDLYLSVGGLGTRSQASQGEQRSTALALRLGGHQLVSDRQSTGPVLLLDDVFSELDPARSAALARCLPPGQVLLSAAGPVPARLPVTACAEVRSGVLYPTQGP